jgi:hypothetical protein
VRIVVAGLTALPRMRRTPLVFRVLRIFPPWS